MNNITDDVKMLLEEEKVKARIKKKYTEGDRVSCWPWNGAKTGGYGKIGICGKLVSVHRIIAMQNGLDIEGKEVHHICGHRDCCNPLHIEIKVSPEIPRKGGSMIRFYEDHVLVYISGEFSLVHKETYETTLLTGIHCVDDVKLSVDGNRIYEIRDGRRNLLAVGAEQEMEFFKE